MEESRICCQEAKEEAEATISESSEKQRKDRYMSTCQLSHQLIHEQDEFSRLVSGRKALAQTQLALTEVWSTR
jgi:hypothetical protein